VKVKAGKRSNSYSTTTLDRAAIDVETCRRAFLARWDRAVIGHPEATVKWWERWPLHTASRRYKAGICHILGRSLNRQKETD